VSGHAGFFPCGTMEADAQYLTHIFGVSKRLHGQEYEGTGIRLAMCQKIVERNGERIWVESERGQGIDFFLYLAGSRPSALTELAAPGSPPGSVKKKVEPVPGLDFTHIVPPSPSTILLQMVSPRPVPLGVLWRR
jgi:hypothetical protein